MIVAQQLQHEFVDDEIEEDKADRQTNEVTNGTSSASSAMSKVTRTDKTEIGPPNLLVKDISQLTKDNPEVNKVK